MLNESFNIRQLTHQFGHWNAVFWHFSRKHNITAPRIWPIASSEKISQKFEESSTRFSDNLFSPKYIRLYESTRNLFLNILLCHYIIHCLYVSLLRAFMYLRLFKNVLRGTYYPLLPKRKEAPVMDNAIVTRTDRLTTRIG